MTLEKNVSRQPLPPGSIHEVLIDSAGDDGTGRCRLEGRTVTVPRTAPGDRCRIRILESNRRYASAALLAVITPSPHRSPLSRCSHDRCDGCPLIAWSDEAQLRWKEELILREFSRHGIFPDRRHVPVQRSEPSLQYRNSAKLVIGGTAAAPRIGIFRRWTHEVVHIPDCPIHHPLINTIAAVVREGIRKLKIPVYHETSGRGLLRHLVARVDGNGGAAVCFVTAYRSYNEIHHLLRYLADRVPGVEVALQNVNQGTGNVIFGDEDHPLTRKRSIDITLGHLSLTLSPRSFFQVNTAQALSLYRRATEMLRLEGGERVLDLYCGIGGIGLFAARRGIELTGVEFLPEAALNAEKNARRNGLPDARFIAGDAAASVQELVEEGERFDRVILNPPRSGCPSSLLSSLGVTGARRIVYVSCNPATLARDLAILKGNGFREEEVEGFDMFPQTEHVETVVSLVRGEEGSRRSSPARPTPSSRRTRAKRGERGG